MKQGLEQRWESEPERQAEREWEYCSLWWGLLVDLLQAHLHRLKEVYGKDCGECVALP